jgi:hypothetical protein
LTLQEILLVEDTPEILSFKCPVTGWLAWPTVRHVFLSYLIHELAYEWPAFIGPIPALWQHRRAGPALIRALRHNAGAMRRNVLRRPIMMFGTASTMVDRAGKAFNRLSDDLALHRAGDTVVIEDLYPLQYSVPRNRLNQDVLYSLPDLLARQLRAAMVDPAPFRRVADAMTRFLTERVERLFGLNIPPQRQAYMAGLITQFLRRYPFERQRYRRLFEKATPRILLMMAGTTGVRAPAIQVAREMGIAVAEYQHGQFGSGQPEYNFAPTVLNSEAYRATLPDYLLAYGTWWIERINAPLQCFPIGNPHRTESLLSYRPAPRGGAPCILIVTKLGEAATYLELAGQLDRHFDGEFRIRLRTNPRDQEFARRTTARWEDRIIELDNNPDFYASLLHADIVVSGPSTVLTESIGVASRIFIWDAVGGAFKYPERIFERFGSVDELIEALKRPAADCPDRPEIDALWAPGWRHRYSAFVDSFLT